jgi:hypothetical protein
MKNELINDKSINFSVFKPLLIVIFTDLNVFQISTRQKITIVFHKNTKPLKYLELNLLTVVTY